MGEHLNQMPARTGKIYGVIKSGANTTDVKSIKQYQANGYNEHEIQAAVGVNYVTVRSFMKINDPEFEITEVPVNAETKHLHDRIAELEGQVQEMNEEEI